MPLIIITYDNVFLTGKCLFFQIIITLSYFIQVFLIHVGVLQKRNNNNL